MKCRYYLALALAVLLPLVAFAKAAYWGKVHMIEHAEFIAVVTITKVEPAKEKRTGWTYSKAATVTVEQVIKGKLAKKVVLHGGEDFICAQVHYQPGRHLVFLRRDGDLLVGENWHLGVREIKDDSLDWFTDDKSLKLKRTSLAEVLSEISARLAKLEQSPGPNAK